MLMGENRGSRCVIWKGNVMYCMGFDDVCRKRWWNGDIVADIIEWG